MSLTVVKAGEERVGERGFVWRGKVVGDPDSFVTFSVVNESVLGTVITSTGKFYRLRSGKGGVRFVEEVDPAKVPRPRLDPTPRAMGRRDDFQAKPVSQCADGRQIDVLVLYTRAAKVGACSAAGVSSSACGPDEIENTVTMAVGEAITSYGESDIDLGINLLPIMQIDGTYTESNSLQTDKDNLKGGAITVNGTSIPILRNQSHYAADAVVLIVENGNDSQGKADQMNEIQCSQGDPQCAQGDVQSWHVIPSHDKYAAVVVREWATSIQLGHLFAHELGHVLGARHEWGNATESLVPTATFTPTNHAGTYNHGHGEPPSGANTGWYTMMASGVIDTTPTTYCPAACIHVPIWSNPNKTYGGVPTGRATGAKPENNAKRLNESGPLVADYFCHITRPDPNPPIISKVAVVNIQFNSADITWITNKASNSRVEYGPTPAYGSSTMLDPALVTSHSVSLSGLSASTTYHYRVKSVDVGGRWSVSGGYSFTTSPHGRPVEKPPSPPGSMRVQ
ncbi:MAG: fibronectin type III domain-containing protein [Nitrospirota bacterium]